MYNKVTMSLFKKKPKKQVITNAKFELGEFVSFTVKDELYNGFVYDVHRLVNGDLVYDIQIGGECPAIKKDIPEAKIFRRK